MSGSSPGSPTPTQAGLGFGRQETGSGFMAELLQGPTLSLLSTVLAPGPSILPSEPGADWLVMRATPQVHTCASRKGSWEGEFPGPASRRDCS